MTDVMKRVCYLIKATRQGSRKKNCDNLTSRDTENNTMHAGGIIISVVLRGNDSAVKGINDAKPIVLKEQSFCQGSALKLKSLNNLQVFN